MRTQANSPSSARRSVRRKVWGAVLVLLIIGVVAIVVPPIAGALRAHTDARFDRWTNWATIWTAPLTVLLAAITFVGTQIARSTKVSEPGLLTTENEHPLTAPVLGRPLTQVTDPFALEVHRPLEPDVGMSRNLPPLPPYVRRPHDEKLELVTQGAVAGRSGIVVLVGGSSTGKTRACWETLRIIRENSLPDAPWRLWHPIAPSHSEAILKDLPSVAPHTVIWLNEAQLYLGTHNGDEVAAALRELLRDGKCAPILILATLWPEDWIALTTRPGYSAPDPHSQARELLAGRDISVPSEFSETQVRDLANAADPRLIQAASRASSGQVAQYLASAPELLSRYRNALPGPKALVQAAMDVRRLGVGDLIPQSFLEAAAGAYLTDGEWDSLKEDWLVCSLDQVGESGKGAIAPLTLIHPRMEPSSVPGEPAYRLADYLNQHSHHNRRTIIPRAGFWSACETLADRVELRELGNAAKVRGVLRNAARLYKRAAALGDAKAAARLIKGLDGLDPGAPGSVWKLVSNVSLDEIDAVNELVRALEGAGALEFAAALIKLALANVSLDFPQDLTLLLSTVRRLYVDEEIEEHVGPLLARDPAVHVSLDILSNVADLVEQLRLAHASEQALNLARRVAVEARLDEVDGVCRALETMQRLQSTEPLAALLARDPAAHVPLSDLLDLAKLLRSLSKVGAEEQAAVAAARASALPVARENLDEIQTSVDELWESGSKEQAIALARRAATCAGPHNPAESVLVARMLETVEAEEFTSALLDRCPVDYADLTDPAAAFALLDALQGNYAEIDILLERDPATIVACDDPAGLADLLDILMKLDPEQLEHDPIDQVATLCARDLGALILDNPASVAFLLEAMWKAGATEQAGDLARRAAERCGNLAVGAGSLLNALRRVGAESEAAILIKRLPGEGCFERFLVEGENERVYRFGREPDGTPARRWGWKDLDLSGCILSPLEDT